MRVTLFAVLAVLAVSGAAAAEPYQPKPTPDMPLAVLAGVGVRSGDSGEASPLALDALVGAHVSPAFVLGVRIGVTRAATSDSYYDRSRGEIDSSETSTMPIDIGLAAQYSSARFAIAPWFGRQVTRTRKDWETCYFMEPSRATTCSGRGETDWSSDRWSFGATASFDVVATGSNGLAVYLTAQGNTDRALEAVTFGLAYRRK